MVFVKIHGLAFSYVLLRPWETLFRFDCLCSLFTLCFYKVVVFHYLSSTSCCVMLCVYLESLAIRCRALHCPLLQHTGWLLGFWSLAQTLLPYSSLYHGLELAQEKYHFWAWIMVSWHFVFSGYHLDAFCRLCLATFLMAGIFL